MFQLKNFSAYQLAANIISISYHGELSPDAMEMKFLQEDQLEEILYLKEEELAVSLPWFDTIIVSFWDIPIRHYAMLDIIQGIRLLFDNKTIKNLKEVNFKIFTKNPEESLQFLLKFKILSSDNNNFCYLEMFNADVFELNLNWCDQIPAQSKTHYIEQQLTNLNLQTILLNLNDSSSQENQLEIAHQLLKREYSIFFLYFLSNIKIRIDEQVEEQDNQRVEVYIHENWCQQNEDCLLHTFDTLHLILLNYIQKQRVQTTLDMAIILSEQQNAKQMLGVTINQIIIELLLKNNEFIHLIQFSLMPLQIHIDYDISTRTLTININLDMEDHLEMYQEGVIILMNVLVKCRQIEQLDVNIDCDDGSKNTTFQLFHFIMLIHEYQRDLKRKGVLTYNSDMILPRTHKLIQAKGHFQFVVSDNKAVYLLRKQKYIELQKEFLSFLQFLRLSDEDTTYKHITSIVIQCELSVIEQSSSNFRKQLLTEISHFKYLTEFHLLNNKNSPVPTNLQFTHKITKSIHDQICIRKCISLQLLVLQGSLMNRYRKQIIQEIIGYLPEQFGCIEYI